THHWPASVVTSQAPARAASPRGGLAVIEPSSTFGSTPRRRSAALAARKIRSAGSSASAGGTREAGSSEVPEARRGRRSKYRSAGGTSSSVGSQVMASTAVGLANKAPSAKADRMIQLIRISALLP